MGDYPLDQGGSGDGGEGADLRNICTTEQVGLGFDCWERCERSGIKNDLHILARQMRCQESQNEAGERHWGAQ